MKKVLGATLLAAGVGLIAYSVYGVRKHINSTKNKMQEDVKKASDKVSELADTVAARGAANVAEELAKENETK